MKTVLILGATGSVGRSLVDYFAAQADTKVIAVSRRIQQRDMPEGVQAIAVDLLDARAVHDALAPLTVTHMVYAVRIEGGGDTDTLPHPKTVHRQLAMMKPWLGLLRRIPPLWKAMLRQVATVSYATDPEGWYLSMLDNALDALAQSPQQLEQVSLITGGKYAGVHLGPYFHPGWQLPIREEDPRPNGPNFYFDLIDRLAERSGPEGFRYADFRPHFVIGFGAGSPSSLVTALAVYAAAHKHQGLPLRFPGPELAFTIQQEFSDIRLLGALIHHVMDRTELSGEGYHSVNGTPASWADVWPSIAAYFDMEWELIPDGFSLVPYLKEVMGVWPELVEHHGLQPYQWKDLIGIDFFGRVMALPAWPVEYSTEKVRSIGFHQTMDHGEMFRYYFDRLKQDGVIPRF